MYRYIEIKPKFKLGNFSLSISKDIDRKILKNFQDDIANPAAEAFFSPCIKKKSNDYFLCFIEDIDTISLAETLNTLSPWLEDTHFFIYFEHSSRFTFDRLEIIEVVIRKGELDYRFYGIKDLIPNSIFLDLISVGVQQGFNLPIELLMSQQTLWDSEIISYLISECNESIELFLKEAQKAEYSSVDAFSINYELDFLNKLGTALETNLYEKLKLLQEEQQTSILDRLKEKVQQNLDTVSEKDIQKIEEQLNLVFPETFKRIYSEVSDGYFGPGFGFLPLYNGLYSIKNLTILLRKLLSIPDYLVPIVYLEKGVYCFMNTANSAFPVVKFCRFNKAGHHHWHEAYKQQSYSFEEWLCNWLEELFPEIYEVSDC